MSVTATALCHAGAGPWGGALGRAELRQAGVGPAGVEKRSSAPLHHRPGTERCTCCPSCLEQPLTIAIGASPQVIVRCHLCAPRLGTRLEEVSLGCCRQTPASPRVRGGVCGHLCAGTRRRNVPGRREPQKGDPSDPRLTPDVCRACGCEPISATPLQGDSSELEAQGQRAHKHLRFFSETPGGPNVRRKLTS